jgi:hypothetical protein
MVIIDLLYGGAINGYVASAQYSKKKQQFI